MVFILFFFFYFYFLFFIFYFNYFNYFYFYFHFYFYSEAGNTKDDLWEIEIVDSPHEGNHFYLQTSLRLKHVNTGCYLHSHPVQFKVAEGFGTNQEVTCYPNKNDENNIFFINKFNF